MAWKFSHDGHTYVEGDVTLDEWIAMQDLLEGKPWPNPLGSPKHAKAVLSVLIASHTGQSQDAVDKLVGAITTDQLLSMFVEAQDDLPEEYVDGVPQ